MRARILTALIGIPIVLAVLAVPHFAPTLVLAVVAARLSVRELGKLVGSNRAAGAWCVTWAILLGFAGNDAATRPDHAGAFAAIAALTFLGCGTTALSAPVSPSRTPLLSLWVVAPLAMVVWLQQIQFGPALANLATFTLVCLWAGDSAAIFAGRALGGPKMLPAISPNKTWSGGVANLIMASAVGAGAGHVMALGWAHGLTLGALIGIVGQMGDLFQSSLKRHAGLKDSGSLLPGHGGLLDRIDSLLFAAPAVCLAAQILNLR